MALTRAFAGAAGGPMPAEDALVVLVGRPELGAAAARLLRAVARCGERIAVLAVAPDAATARAIAGALGPQRAGIEIRVPPGLGLLPARALLAVMRARALVVLDAPGESRIARLRAGGVARGLPVFALPGAALGADAPPALPLVALSEPAEEGLPAGPLGLDDLAAHLARAVGTERGEAALTRRVARLLRRALAVPAAARLLRPLVRRLGTAEELAAHLGRPEVILCLGNGPTSADPRLAEISRDALFRVNHQWMAQGFLTRADMIFAGVKRSMRAAGRVPLGVATPRKERALLACRALAPWRGPVTYAVVEEIAAGIAPEIAGSRRPTSGAVMIAAAMALAPRRIVVAGMDMFRHPEGAYPGIEAANAYAPSHDFDTDAAFIRACLAHHAGEVVTLSPAFAELARTVPGLAVTLLEAPKAG